MFYNKGGKMALGNRLRMLSENITKDAKKIYALYDVGLKRTAEKSKYEKCILKWCIVLHKVTLNYQTI